MDPALSRSLKIMLDSQYQALIEAEGSQGPRAICVPHSYDPLCNPRYQRWLEYLPASFLDRRWHPHEPDSEDEDNQVQSNAVRIAMNLGYLLPEDQQTLRFERDKLRAAYQEI